MYSLFFISVIALFMKKAINRNGKKKYLNALAYFVLERYFLFIHRNITHTAIT